MKNFSEEEIEKIVEEQKRYFGVFYWPIKICVLPFAYMAMLNYSDPFKMALIEILMVAVIVSMLV